MVKPRFTYRKETKNFMGNEKLIRNHFALNKNTLISGDDFRKSDLKSIFHRFRDDFIVNIA